MSPSPITAMRAKKILSLAGEIPARGRVALDAPVNVLADGVIVARDNSIETVCSYTEFSRRADASAIDLHDLGDVTLVPGFINSHCHLELSHLADKTVTGQGFVPWLQTLVPLASAPIAPEKLLTDITAVVATMITDGTAHVGDVGSRNPLTVAKAAIQVQSGKNTAFPSSLGVTHFLEAFGFGPAYEHSDSFFAHGYFPPATQDLPPERRPHCAVAGHALYTTSPRAMQAAHSWCQKYRRTFSVHLAEHPDEVECLQNGTGVLYDFLAQRILPEGWQPPRMSPTAFAHSLGLLSPHTLAVHSVHCSDADIALLATSRASVCLCPRSNTLINVGTAPAKALIQAGILLCLGTDSLASNTTLSMMDEIRAAQNTWNLSPQAALRMATINGAAALGLEGSLGTLEPGKLCRFAAWKPLDSDRIL